MTEPTAYLTTADGIRLAYRDETPTHPHPHPQPTALPVVLLHGLAGHMGEWDDLTARLLADGHRVVRYDARGHGASTRTPADMTRSAAVSDAAALITHLSLPPATLLDQSLGGVTALLTAATHPPLVRSLILLEAGPAGRNAGLPEQIGEWLDSWPTPFPSHHEATTFLGHTAWADGLDWRTDGGHARVDRATMIAAATDLATEGYWTEWAKVTCPTLLVRGERGTMPATEPTDMLAGHPAGNRDTHLAVVPNAGHDVHLDQPQALHETVAPFLRTAPDGDPEPPEHARYADHLQALRRVEPADEERLIRAVLTDPDLTMARSAVLHHLDRSATELHRTPAYEPWSESMTRATAADPFLTTRLQEWTLLRAITLSHPWHPSALTEASNWLQRKLTESPDTPTPALTLLAEHGRTRKVRNTARTRTRRTSDSTP